MSTAQEQPSTGTSQTPKVTDSNPVTRTRSGRTVKAPERYTPQEVCEDDYADDDYDSQESGSVSSEVSYDTEDISSESDADEEGNLAGFIVEDKSSSDSEGNGSDVRSESGETDVSSDRDERRPPATPARGRGRGRGAPSSARRTLVL
jgi:hypothetical protein